MEGFLAKAVRFFPKPFLNSKINCIYGSFKKKISFLRHTAKKLQARQLSQKGLSENVTLALKSF